MKWLSGDQVGWRASSRRGVKGLASPPPNGISQRRPTRSNAIQRRSGETAAAIDVPSLSVMSMFRTGVGYCPKTMLASADASAIQRATRSASPTSATLRFRSVEASRSWGPRSWGLALPGWRRRPLRYGGCCRDARPGFGFGALQLCRALDDLREHGAGVAAFRGPMRFPHSRRILAEDVFEVAVALDAARREFGDVQIARPSRHGA